MTALASGGKLVGRRLTLSVGYPGMNSTDFVTIATQEIEGVEVLPSGGGYRLDCHDLNRYAKSQIFASGRRRCPPSRNSIRGPCWPIRWT